MAVNFEGTPFSSLLRAGRGVQLMCTMTLVLASWESAAVGRPFQGALTFRNASVLTTFGYLGDLGMSER